MTKEEAEYIWNMILDEIYEYGSKNWCNDRDIDIVKFAQFTGWINEEIEERY